MRNKTLALRLRQRSQQVVSLDNARIYHSNQSL
jgi:hypothetical protein